MMKRRALSPNANNTYIALSNVNFQNDRYQEQPLNLKLKLINAYVHSKTHHDKINPCTNNLNSQKVDEEELNKKKWCASFDDEEIYL